MATNGQVSISTETSIGQVGGLSTAAIVGITLGSVALVIILIVLAVFIHRRNSKRQQAPVVITMP